MERAGLSGCGWPWWSVDKVLDCACSVALSPFQSQFAGGKEHWNLERRVKIVSIGATKNSLWQEVIVREE